MEIHLSSGEVRIYSVDDILVVEDYPGRNNRWDETAVIFKDYSIYWDCGSCSKYVVDGKKYLSKNRVTSSGAYSSVPGDKITRVVNFEKAMNEFKTDKNLVVSDGTYDDEDYSFIWEHSSIR